MEHLSLLLLLLLLPICRSQVFYAGTVMTFYLKQINTDGSITVEFRYKTNTNNCYGGGWGCLSGCFSLDSWNFYDVDSNSQTEFCQTEGIWVRTGQTPFQLYLWDFYHLNPYNYYSDSNWITPIVNGITGSEAFIQVELRNRSDTGQPNRSPQTTILSIFRVPSNCQRDIPLLTFDPDGDLLKCRFANNSINARECSQCTPPSVLSLSPTCTLSFSPADNNSTGLYAVQLMMEEFPRTKINLTQINGVQEVKTPTDTLSRIPVQFVFSVESAAPSCTEGLYLPRFVEPTPEHGAQLNVNVSQTLQIYIRAEANVSTISELLFSGPHNMTETNSSGQYILSWTPAVDEAVQSHPVCFSVQAVLNMTKYQSVLRCVIVNVGKVDLFSAPSTTAPATTTMITSALTTTPNTSVSPPNTTTTAPATTTMITSALTTTLNTSVSPPNTTTTTAAENGDSITFIVIMKVQISSLAPLSEDDLRTVLQQFKQKLVNQGLPSNVVVSLVNGTSTAPPAG